MDFRLEIGVLCEREIFVGGGFDDLCCGWGCHTFRTFEESFGGEAQPLLPSKQLVLASLSVVPGSYPIVLAHRFRLLGFGFCETPGGVSASCQKGERVSLERREERTFYASLSA